MKRILAVLMMVTVCFGVLTACDSRIGTYHLQSMVADGEVCDETVIETLGLSGTALVLNDDDTCTITVFEEEVSGTWDDGHVSLSGVVYDASWESGTLTLTLDNSSMVFVKA